ncbi:MAG TPA: metallophosphoesterase [Actinotalea sp.]
MKPSPDAQVPPDPQGRWWVGSSLPAGVLRRVLRWLAVLVAVVLPATAWGVATASAQAGLGPHLARYEVTLDHEVTVDLGPLGTVVIDSPLPLVLGARVVVEEIPRELTAVDGSSTLNAVGSDLQRYVAFFTAPQATLDAAVRALVADAVRRSVLASLTLLVLGWLARRALGPTRRRELVTELRPYRVATAGACIVVLLVASTLTGSEPLRAVGTNPARASAVFDGTPLEGARITGRLAGLIDTYGGKLVDAYRSNESFYNGTVAALDASWAERQESDARLEAARAAARGALLPAAGTSSGGDATPDPTASATAGEPSASPDGSATPSEQPTPSPTPTPDPGPPPVTVLVVSDLHCNVGMARVIREVVKLSGAKVVLNAGDSTLTGTAVEQYCVSTFVRAAPRGVRTVISDGNHDSDTTAEQERDAGATVLDGKPIEVEGIRILGDHDPNATRLGIGTSLNGSETLVEEGRRLADTACSDDSGIDVLLVHNPDVGNATMDLGCAGAQISGHLHKRVGPVVRGGGVRYVNASTAGASLYQVTVGPLHGVAEMTLLRFDPQSRRFIDYRLILARPDGTVSVGLAATWPGVPTPQEPDRGPR